MVRNNNESRKQHNCETVKQQKDYAKQRKVNAEQ